MSKLRLNFKMHFNEVAIIVGLLCAGALIFIAYYSYQNRYCHSLSCRRSARALLSSVNTSVDPCEDFYAFACGNFAQNVRSYNDWTEYAKELILRNTSSYLEIKEVPEDPLSVTQAKLLYRQCKDAFGRQNDTFEPIAQILQQVGLPVLPPLLEASSNFSLTNAMARSKTIFNMDFFISFSLYDDLPKHFISLSKPPNISPLNAEKISSSSNRYQDEHHLPEFMVKMAQFHSPAENDSLFHLHGTIPEDYRVAFRTYVLDLVQFAYDFVGKSWDSSILAQLTNSLSDDIISNLMMTDILVEKLYSIVYSQDMVRKNYFRINADGLQMWSDGMRRNGSDGVKIDWRQYFTILFEDEKEIKLNFEDTDLEGEILLTDFHYMTLIMTWLMSTASTQQIELYMWWKTVNEIAPFTSGKLREAQLRFLKHTKIIQRTPRNLKCAEIVNNLFPLATSIHLLDDTDVLYNIEEVTLMIEDIRTALEERIENANWMNEEAKTSAINKVKNTRKCVGFPDRMREASFLEDEYRLYSQIEIGENTFLSNILKLVQAKFKDTMKLLRMPVPEDTGDQCSNMDKPLEHNAFNFRGENEIGIPIGYLLFPFFRHNILALNYGTIGFTIAHEFGHNFDTAGVEYDSEGNASPWMVGTVIREYEDRVQCFVDQYDSFLEDGNRTKQRWEAEYYVGDADEDFTHLNWTKYLGVSNGRRTLDENIADNIGLKSAFRAFQYYALRNGPGPTLPGLKQYTREQLFFLGLAVDQCTKHSEKYAQYLDEHSPPHIRVWGMLTNSDEFAETWKCKKGTRMNPLEDKCELF